MRPLFADTFFYLALLNPDDSAHEQAIGLAKAQTAATVTTAWVMTELADALAGPAHRQLLLALLANLASDPTVLIAARTRVVRAWDPSVRATARQTLVTDGLHILRRHG